MRERRIIREVRFSERVVRRVDRAAEPSPKAEAENVDAVDAGEEESIEVVEDHPRKWAGPLVLMVRPLCPECGGNGQVVKTYAPYRYHVCGDCGLRYKSVERRQKR